MPKEFGRDRRVAKLIKKELAVLIHDKFPVKQYGLITLTNVNVSPDLKNSTIFFTNLNTKKPNMELIDELNQQASYFRYEISKLITSRTVPSLSFKYDQSIERGQRINNIIEMISNQNDENGKTEKKS